MIFTSYYVIKDKNSTFQAFDHKIIVSDFAPGSYYHFGIESGLVRQFSMLGIESFEQSVISIYVGIDGVSLSKSSKSTFWIIAGFMDQIITA